MAARTRSRGLEVEPLNLTPLLDVLFNLIFFFVLATTLKEETQVMEVKLPKSAVHERSPAEKREWVVTVGRKGEIFLNEDAVTTEQLRIRLSAAARLMPEPLPVRIRCDRQTPVQVLVDVMSICHESGHPTFALEVKGEKKGP